MLALLLVPFALAGRVERVTELRGEGDHAGVIETVGKWEKAGNLGDEAAALIALRDRSALDLALAARTVDALRQYRQDWPQSTLFAEATSAEWQAAFAAAQDEGTSAAMLAYITTYADSTFRAQAIALEVSLAFEEATSVGTAAAIAAFTDAHPDSPFAATAWESLAARTPGIHLRLADGLPQVLEGVPVVDGYIQFPSRLVMAPARPVVAVNLPGTGRGGTSEWWGLVALGPDGKVGVAPPVGRLLEETVGAQLPGLLDLVPLPGMHSARVAAPTWPLVAPGACEGFARFAYVLAAEGTRTAFSFAVPCAGPVESGPVESEPVESGPVGPVESTALTDLLAAFQLAEAGDVRGALDRWDRASKGPEGARLLTWMESVSPDPRASLLLRGPAVGDVLLWDGVQTTWWHPAEGGAVELARRDGLWVADGAHLWSWAPRAEPWNTPAVGRCKAATGEREAATLVDALGSNRVDVAFTVTPRTGTLTPVGVGAGAIEIDETPGEAGCAPLAPPIRRTLPLPGLATPPASPAWAATTIADARGASVVSETPRSMFAAFTAPVAPKTVAPETVAPETVAPETVAPETVAAEPVAAEPTPDAAVLAPPSDATETAPPPAITPVITPP
ncbi:MAG: hypothetical protein Q8P18_12780 [Pseudomonadota bacterium]|nr:hypothetical protein [Pseudomonadota bacterium]